MIVVNDGDVRCVCNLLALFHPSGLKPETIYEGFTLKIFPNRGLILANLYEFRRDVSPDSADEPSLAQPWRRIWAWAILALLPCLSSAIYLFGFAADQYVVRAGFSVRSVAGPDTINPLAGLSGLTGATHTEGAMAAAYLLSENLVAQLTEEEITSLSDTTDPLFPIPKNRGQALNRWENLSSARMDSRTGLVTFQLRAFDPADAQAMAERALDRTASMIAALSEQYQTDATAAARARLNAVQKRTRAARDALTEYRVETQSLAPEAALEIQVGLLTQLQAELSQAKIALALLMPTTNWQDSRVIQAKARVDAIETLIAEERAKISASDAGQAAIATRFEALRVELDYAIEAELIAQAALDPAQQEAMQNGVYLAIHLVPIAPENAEYPKRWWNLLAISLFSVLGAGILFLTVTGLRGAR